MHLFTILLAAGLALSPAWSGGQGSPEVSQETIDALAANPGVDDTLPDYTETPAFAGPTGFEDTGVAFADPTAPQSEATVLPDVARRVTFLDASDGMVEVYRAAGGFDLPSPWPWTALGMRWYAAVEDQDYEQMAEIVVEIEARRRNFPRSAPVGRRAE